MSERTMNFCGHEIRIIETPNGPLFNMEDVCAALGENLDEALSRMDPADLVQVVPTN